MNLFCLSFSTVESPETIQSLNPWVKIPEDWKNAHTDEGITSSEEYYASSAQVHSGSGHSEGKSDIEPYFDHAVMTNLSEHLGSHAFLRCHIKNLGDRMVSTITFVNFSRIKFPLSMMNESIILD